ncbi:GerAB/ArcD/ProY family transporter [Garciella nitratireducens]|uniref:GerAB/ArcD/ProY family transporter n=1 Tax=Garciella nitratireducens TaxID=218205 RepID=UPI000DE95A83|nr:GerAB/ArcD/ProY family transporter [Garciella nitratireducens]RBP45528.1 spore germination protein KB [Garciella nitratireducens]
MNNIKIDLKQIFILIVLFELGSAIVIGLAREAKQDAWFAVLLAMLGGMLLFMVYGYLFKRYPALTLTNYLQVILGKVLGKIIAFCYCSYFIYIAARVLRDFGELLLSSTLVETPMIIVNFFMILVIAYALYLGIEVLAKTGEVCFFIIVGLGLLFVILAFVAKLPKIENLQPFLENGISTIIKKTFITTLTFPFGEMIVFTMILPLVDKPSFVIKVSQKAIITSGILLILVTMLNISVQGVYIIENATFPLLKTVGKIKIGEVIQRLDGIAIFTLIIGVFFKISIFLYAAITGISDIFTIKNTRKIIFFVSIITLILSLIMAKNYSQHIKIGLKRIPIFIHVPFQVIIPFILMGITYLKQRNILRK